MGAKDLLGTLSRKVERWIWSLADALPPYHVAEGRLDAKEVGEDGRLILWVGTARIEVDQATFDTLSVGERLRVRYTRGARAINIDRYVSQNGHQ